MADFLEKLKHRQAVRSKTSSVAVPEKDIFFQILFNSDGEAVLNVVDFKGKPTNPDFRVYDGPVFNVLRSVDQARADSSFNISWGESPDGVSLVRNPQILYQLLDCSNIYDGKLNFIRPDRNGLWEPRITIYDTGKAYQPTVCLSCDGERLENPQMVNDSFAICAGKLVRLKTMIGNYQSLPVFLDKFPKELLDKYLSVLYSNLDNIKVSVNGVQVIEDPEVEHSRPTIVIEKVDEDKALYLRLTQELPGIEPDFVEDFRLTRHAFTAPDGTLRVRTIDQGNTSAMQSSLLKSIAKYAPNKAAAKEIFNDGGTFIIPEHTASPFLFGGLASLVSEFRLVGAEKLKGYKVRPATPKLSLKLGSGIDFLEADASLKIGEDEYTLASFLQQYRKQNYILLSDGDKAVIDENWIRRLERLFSKGKKGKSVVSYFDLPEIVGLLEDGALSDNGAVKRSREFLQGFNDLPSAQLDDGGIKATLRPYQEVGIKWLDYLYDNGFGACLADDMGLGKTVQAISLLCRIYGTGKRPKSKKPSIIIMPRSLLFNWESELARFAPSIKVSTYYGPSRNLDESLKASVVLTTYGMVRSDVEKFREIDFNLVILDESQNIKNVNAQMTQAVLLLKAQHRLALSGTPIENDLSELYSLFRFLNPAMFGSFNDFNGKFGGPIADGDKDVLDELRRKIYPYILRRTKSEVLQDLPDRTDQKLYITLDEAHASFYEQRRRAFYEAVHSGIAKDGLAKSKLLVLQALSELRRIASVPEYLSDGLVRSSKIPVLMESLEEAVANGHKVVVFFNFIAGIELVGERLDQDGIGYETMTGSTRDRGSVVSRFQEDPSCKVLLMTLKTGGVGLNLTAADTVYIFEPWWNRAEEEQAIGRLHRIGQKANVLTFSMIAAGTIEDKICKLQEQKKVLVDSLIGSDGNIDKALTEEDIDFMLGNS